MTLVRWDPFGEMTSLRNAMDRLLENAVVRPGTGFGGETSFPMDVIERGDDVIVKASLPGVKPQDVNISVEDNVLTISGEIHEDEEGGQGQQQQGTQAQSQQSTQGDGQQNQQHQQGQGAQGQSRQMQSQQSQGKQMQSHQSNQQPRYHFRERRWGRFMRQVILPFDVNADKATADFENGVLTVTLPKAETAKKKQIQVQGGGQSQRTIEGHASQTSQSQGQSQGQAQHQGQTATAGSSSSS